MSGRSPKPVTTAASSKNDTDYGHSFGKKKEHRDQLFVQYLDDPKDGHLTLQDFERSNLSAVTMKELEPCSVGPTTYGENRLPILMIDQ